MNEIGPLARAIAGGHPTVLLVDDDPRILETGKDILEDGGYAVETAADGAETLRRIEARDFNVVILDFQLPDATGLELARKIRERNPLTSMILMTGHASLEMAVQAIQEAVYDYLIKPVDPSQLKKTIAKALEQQSLTLENRRLLEDLKAANALMARLNALKMKMMKVMSHDLRTPLSSIRGYSELLKSGVKGKLTEVQKKMLEITIHEADHMNGLIGELLDLANIDAGNLVIETRDTPFDAILDKALARVRLASEMKEIPVELIVGAEPPVVKADAPRLIQVFSNLMRSALKYSSKGGKIFVNTRAKGDQIELEIAYSGQGFSREELDTLFVADRSMEEPKGSRDGLKIMLTIAREVIRAHHGEIGVESRGAELGATFWARLPVVKNVSE